MPNKIKYGLSNVKYAKCTYDTALQAYTYGAIKALPGGVSISMSAKGELSEHYADNIVFYTSNTNAGYEGDVEIMNITDEFRQDILNETVDTNGVQIENSDAQGAEFALMFQFEGDVSARRHIMWRCKADRPNVESDTKEDKIAPKTDKLSLKAMARENDHNVKGFVDNKTETASVYSNWYNAVYQPINAVPSTATVNLASAEDIAVTVSGGTPTAVKNGSTTLTVTTDYTISGNTVTLKSAYLGTLTAGTATITIVTSAGNVNITLTVVSGT